LKDRTWTLSGGRGLRPITIKTIEQVMVQMPYGDDRLMWRTTLQRPPARKGYAPILKIGAAVSGGSLEFPENVTKQPDEVSRRVARRIVSLFVAKEKARLAEHGFYEVSADSLPIVIKLLTRHTAAGITTYYFEATRSVRNSLGGIAPDLGLLTGWITETASELLDFEVAFKINDDASKQNERAIVRGIIPYKGKALWLLEWHGWESEYYTVHDWPSGRLLVTVGAYK
jgi:hypothetical protein